MCDKVIHMLDVNNFLIKIDISLDVNNM